MNQKLSATVEVGNLDAVNLIDECGRLVLGGDALMLAHWTERVKSLESGGR